MSQYPKYHAPIFEQLTEGCNVPESTAYEHHNRNPRLAPPRVVLLSAAATGRRPSCRGLVNGFIAGKRDALFDAPGAYYRTLGADAVDGAPAIARRRGSTPLPTMRWTASAATSQRIR